MDNLLCTTHQPAIISVVQLHYPAPCVEGKRLGEPPISQDQENERQNLNISPLEYIVRALLVGWRKTPKSAQLVSQKGRRFLRVTLTERRRGKGGG
jgi:hypothetical protein